MPLSIPKKWVRKWERQREAEEGREGSHVWRCQQLWRRWKAPPSFHHHQAEERHFGLQSVWFLTSGTRGQPAQPLTTAFPDVQFVENNATQTLKLTRMLLGWTVVSCGFFLQLTRSRKSTSLQDYYYYHYLQGHPNLLVLHGAIMGKYAWHKLVKQSHYFKRLWTLTNLHCFTALYRKETKQAKANTFKSI